MRGASASIVSRTSLAREDTTLALGQLGRVEHRGALEVELPREPRRMRSKRRVDRTVARAHRDDELRRLPGPPDGAEQPRARRFAHLHLDEASSDVDDPHPLRRYRPSRRAQSAKRRTTMHALWPPKPNELEHATSMSGASRASFGM